VIDPGVVPTCDRQREVLQAIRSRGWSLTRAPQCGRTVILKLPGRTIAVQGGLRSLTLGEVQRLGRID